MDVFSQKTRFDDPIGLAKYVCIVNDIRYVDSSICWEKLECTRRHLYRNLLRFITKSENLFAINGPDDEKRFFFTTQSFDKSANVKNLIRFDCFLIAILTCPIFPPSQQRLVF